MVQPLVLRPMGIGYWLLITSRESWTVLQQRKEWAFPDNRYKPVPRVKPGDKGVVYLRKDGTVNPPALGGVVDFNGEPHKIRGKTMFDERFPIRVPLEVVKVASEPIPFIRFVEQLEFITKKSNWAGHIRGRSAVGLGKKDYDVLTTAMNEV